MVRKFKQENQLKASNFAEQPWLEMTKDDIVRIRNMQRNKMNIIIQDITQVFYRKYSDVTPFVIINISISN